MLDRRAFLYLLACAAPMTLAACGAKGGETEPQPEEERENVANPFIDCSSAAEAAGIAGFDVTFPESVPGYSQRHYQAIEGELAQCFYYETEDGPRVLIRKALDSEDISGVYEEFAKVESVAVGDDTVTMKSTDGLVYVASWFRGEYAFAIDADEGLDPEVMEHLVAATL